MKAQWGAMIVMAVLTGQAEPARPTISAHQVARALSSESVQFEDGQVTLLAKVAVAEADPQLEVLEAAPAHGLGGGGDRWLVKLRCHAQSSCLPFYVLVEGEVAAPKAAVLRAGAHPIAATQPRAKITMRAGTHATLLMDSARAHIEVAVVSLENGASGSRIRVATLDRKEFFEGVVIGPNLLKGRF